MQRSRNQLTKPAQRVLNKLLFPLVVAVACLAANSIAISVSNTGIATITFNAQPSIADFSSRTWSGAATDFQTAAAMDTAVQTNSASLFNVALTAAAADPPAALIGPGQWSSTGFYIATRPTQVAGALVLATLVNNSGSSRNSVVVDYDLTVVEPLAEEIKGHLVYYSMTGQPNSWVQIASISNQANDNTAGTYHKNATLDLSATPWAIGATIYVLWADDNGSGTPDTALEIDNFGITFPSGITLIGPANGQHFSSGSGISASVTLTVSPTNVSYFVDGTLAAVRTSAPFSPVSLPSQAVGSHTIYATARDTNDTFLTTVTNIFTIDSCAGGAIAANTTWYASNSPVMVCASVTVNSGVTLTIEAGTTVELAAGVNIVVANGGILMAQGTSNAPILFTRSGASGNWGKITINGAVGSPESRITYARFEFNVSDQATPAILVNGGAAFLDHLDFATPTSPYIHVDQASFVISHCYFPKVVATSAGGGFEPCHGTNGVRTDGHGIFLRNFFGHATNYNDIVDFTGSQRGKPIVHFIDNVITGGDDDGWDIDGTDAWVEHNIFLHMHKNGGTPDSSSGVSGGSFTYSSGNPAGTGTETSQITVIGNLFFDCDEASDAKEGNFFTYFNNTIVHQTHVGGIDSTGAVVILADSGTAQGAGIYLEGNVIYDIETLTRNVTTAIVTYSNNVMPVAYAGPGGGNTIANPMLKHVPVLSETLFTNWAQAQVMWDWFSLLPGSPAIGTGPNSTDRGAVIPIGASISGEPLGTTTNNTATLHVGINRTGSGIPVVGWPSGSGYVAYKWRLDGGAWSAETPINTPITLTGLTDGAHYVEVTGKRDSGLYQDDPLFQEDAVLSRSRTWNVQHSLQITSPTVSDNQFILHFPAAAGNTYTVQYRDAFDAALPWTDLTNIPAQPSTGDFAVTNSPLSSSNRFYRVVTPAQ